MAFMDSRWVVLIVACLVIIGVAVGAAFLSHDPDEVKVPEGPSEDQVLEVRNLLGERRFEEVVKKLDPLLGLAPKRTDLNYFMGVSLFQLQKYERALPHLWVATGDKRLLDTCRFQIGSILEYVDRPGQALPLLEEPLRGEKTTADEFDRIIRLAWCYIALEQFKDALELLRDQPNHSSVLRIRDKALRYLGRGEEADRLLEELEGTAQDDLRLKAGITYIRSGVFREEGDFARAFKAFKKIREELSGEPGGSLFMDRAELALLLEADEGERLEKAATDLASKSRSKGKWHGDALWYRTVVQLQAGRREDALATAKEFFESVDLDFSPLRLEILMMRQLIGEVEVADVEKEAKQVSRFRSNVLYYFLALSTGDRTWAERAKEATYGRNFPYHSIQRLLKK